MTETTKWSSSEAEPPGCPPRWSWAAPGAARWWSTRASRGYRAGAAINGELLLADLDSGAPRRGAGNGATGHNGSAVGNAPHQADE
jgi:hypothetical protein